MSSGSCVWVFYLGPAITVVLCISWCRRESDGNQGNVCNAGPFGEEGSNVWVAALGSVYACSFMNSHQGTSGGSPDKVWVFNVVLIWFRCMVRFSPTRQCMRIRCKPVHV